VDYLRFNATLLEAVAGRPVCVGHRPPQRPVDILHFRKSAPDSTCFFFLPPTEVKALGRLATIQMAALQRKRWRAFRPAAPLSTAYRAHITDWLNGRDIGQESSGIRGSRSRRDAAVVRVESRRHRTSNSWACAFARWGAA
jgi:hypothetical protein